MRLFFRDELFDGQLLRTLSHCRYGGAEISECLEAARNIPEKDLSRWFTVWFDLAERVRKEAEQSRLHGHPISARDGFLRASNYYRNAYIFLFQKPPDSKLRQAYQLHRLAFRQAMETLAEEVQIPYEQTSLRGYFLRAPGETPRPTLILNGGYDSTAEECYFWNAAAGLRRGYHCLIFDGPGQGSALIEQELPFRPDWEAVIRPIVDWLQQRPEVKAGRIGIVGLSFGGYLALRAASGEARLAACVADPGQFSLLDIFRAHLPGILARGLQEDGASRWLLLRIMLARLHKPTAGWALRRALWVHGVDTLEEYLSHAALYSLEGKAGQIRCPTLVCSAEDDEIAATAGQSYDALNCEKEFLTFLKSEGASEHCEAGSRMLFHQRAFDWLDRQLYLEPSP
jgi:alpha-beta hydrolase superfamily lysophospholipase